ncbi:MAG TPA: hypothetical protein DDW52_13135 [Planctomycetaceae bacterium]|nr:hypothetical protein [Planctomycetaceae bacterium]
MRDLTNPKAIIAKGLLFLVLGGLASAIILVIEPDLRIAALHIVAIWAFCRFYYFAFYVIEHYVDDGYRFDGLVSAAKYLVSRWRVRE